MYLYILVLCVYFCGWNYIIAGVFKIFSQGDFKDNIHIFKARYINSFIAIIIPIVEVFIGILLVTNLFYPFSLILAIILQLVFVIYLSIRIYQGSETQECGCYGSIIRDEINLSKVWFNVTFFVILIASLFIDNDLNHQILLKLFGLIFVCAFLVYKKIKEWIYTIPRKR